MQVPEGKFKVLQIFSGEKPRTLKRKMPWLKAMSVACQSAAEQLLQIKSDEVNSMDDWDIEMTFRTSLDGYDIQFNEIEEQGERVTYTYLVVEDDK